MEPVTTTPLVAITPTMRTSSWQSRKMQTKMACPFDMSRYVNYSTWTYMYIYNVVMTYLVMTVTRKLYDIHFTQYTIAGLVVVLQRSREWS